MHPKQQFMIFPTSTVGIATTAGLLFEVDARKSSSYPGPGLSGNPSLTDIGVTGIGTSGGQLSGTTAFRTLLNSAKRITTTSTSGTVSDLSLNLLGPAGLTSSTTPTVGNNDDGYWKLTLPFNVQFTGITTNIVYPGTNSYITFISGSTVRSTFSGFNNPSLPKILISSADNSCQTLYYGQEGSSPNSTYRIRWEGISATSTNLVTESPNMIHETVFYENNPNQIDVNVGSNARVEVTWYDTSGNNRDWKLVNGPTYSSTNLEFDFNGIDDYTYTPHASWIPQGSSAKSCEVYMNINAWRTGQWVFCMTKTSPSSQSFSYGFEEASGDVYYGLQSQGGGTFASGGPYRVKLTNPSQYLNTYVHCVMTYDGTTARLYLNGTELYNATGTFHTNTARLRMMCFDPGNSNTYWHWYIDGQLRMGRMYDRALTADEVLNNYNQAK
jgi:hypothetical protein